MALDIEKTEAEIARLQAAVDEEKSRLSKMRPEWMEAEYLHNATCTLNHTDACGYEYEKWPVNPGDTWGKWSTKKDYVIKAAIVKEKTGLPIEEAVRIYKIVKYGR